MDVIIIEWVPLDAKRKADIKNTAILKVIPFPDTKVTISAVISNGNTLSNISITLVEETDK